MEQNPNNSHPLLHKIRGHMQISGILRIDLMSVCTFNLGSEARTFGPMSTAKSSLSKKRKFGVYQPLPFVIPTSHYFKLLLINIQQLYYYADRFIFIRIRSHQANRQRVVKPNLKLKNMLPRQVFPVRLLSLESQFSPTSLV